MTEPFELIQPLLPIHTVVLGREQVGGKALNLSRLATAGFPTPPGFIIPASSYLDFVRVNKLESIIQGELDSMVTTSPESLNRASGKIRLAFEAGIISKPLETALEHGWHWLGRKPVAVRSSATTEDLPEASFAGQYDTFLNVVGFEELYHAVKACWSSLWTVRAIGYRERNQISHDGIALCVVVQLMVQADVAGVMFTANPLTGRRNEIVIDAAFGLGEVLVSGQVSPDHYVLNQTRSFIQNDLDGDRSQEYEMKILQKSLGSKERKITGTRCGGVILEDVVGSNLQALPDGAILSLARLGLAIENFFKYPQDIEWAWIGARGIVEGERQDVLGKFHVLQARPVTSLYPLMEGVPLEPLQVFFSFGAVQGFLDPITPLGQDAIRLIFAGGASLFGFEMDQNSQGVIKVAGCRLWVNLTSLLHHPIGVKIVPKVFPGVEPGSVEAIKEIIQDPSLKAGQGRLRFDTFKRIARFAFWMGKKVLHCVCNPEQASIQIPQMIEAEITGLQNRVSHPPGIEDNLDTSVNLFRELYGAFIFAIPEIVSGILAGLLPVIILNRFAKKMTGANDLALQITRGLPNNVTTAMDLALWEATQQIKNDQQATDYFKEHEAENLAERFLEDDLPESIGVVIARFLERFGMRGIGEIDLGRPRWRENPVHIFQVMKSYMQIEVPEMAPDIVFQAGQKQAEMALEKLIRLARDSSVGRLKSRIIRAAARRVRCLAGLRESPKFFIVQMMEIIRQELLVQGDYLVRDGVFEERDDLFFLYLGELEKYSSLEKSKFKFLVAERRMNHNREKLRNRIPRLLTSDGRAFYEGIESGVEGVGELMGSPVSPGIVEGMVRVVVDPLKTAIEPGEILVCPATDPAWTPLFLAASGLVMEVGGMMTHGSVVAREYGIPAVVGVHQATISLQTGMHIRLDGTRGRITILG